MRYSHEKFHFRISIITSKCIYEHYHGCRYCNINIRPYAYAYAYTRNRSNEMCMCHNECCLLPVCKFPEKISVLSSTTSTLDEIDVWQMNSNSDRVFKRKIPIEHSFRQLMKFIGTFIKLSNVANSLARMLFQSNNFQLMFVGGREKERASERARAKDSNYV